MAPSGQPTSLSFSGRGDPANRRAFRRSTSRLQLTSSAPDPFIPLFQSRKAYSEVVYRQTAEQFIRCLEDAFWHFGGEQVKIIQLKRRIYALFKRRSHQEK